MVFAPQSWLKPYLSGTANLARPNDPSYLSQQAVAGRGCGREGCAGRSRTGRVHGASKLGRLIGEQGEHERGEKHGPPVVGPRVIEPRSGPAARRSELLNKGRLLGTKDIRYFITSPTFETTSEKYARIECELSPWPSSGRPGDSMCPAARVFLDEPDLCAGRSLVVAALLLLHAFDDGESERDGSRLTGRTRGCREHDHTRRFAYVSQIGADGNGYRSKLAVALHR